MGRHAQQRSRVGLQPMWGPLTRIGLLVAVISAALDQASKVWLLYVFDLPARAPVRLAPFLDLVMTWNKGISYGLFQQDGPLGQGVLLAIKVAAVVLLLIWLARAPSRLTAVVLGLIIGGAAGNAVDIVLHGAVAGFILFHILTDAVRFNWYVIIVAYVVF